MVEAPDNQKPQAINGGNICISICYITCTVITHGGKMHAAQQKSTVTQCDIAMYGVAPQTATFGKVSPVTLWK